MAAGGRLRPFFAARLWDLARSPKKKLDGRELGRSEFVVFSGLMFPLWMVL
jgi:hypothetical protein